MLDGIGFRLFAGKAQERWWVFQVSRQKKHNTRPIHAGVTAGQNSRWQQGKPRSSSIPCRDNTLDIGHGHVMQRPVAVSQCCSTSSLTSLVGLQFTCQRQLYGVRVVQQCTSQQNKGAIAPPAVQQNTTKYLLAYAYHLLYHY